MIHLKVKKDSPRVVREGLRQLSLNFSKFNLISKDDCKKNCATDMKLPEYHREFSHSIKHIGQHGNSTWCDEKDVA